MTGENVEVVLQEGLNGYLGTSDSHMYYAHINGNFGGSTSMLSQSSRFNFMIKFKLFESEGGTIPDGAEILSANLSFYKTTNAYQYVWNAKAIKPLWSEAEVTWNNSTNNSPWSTPGGTGNGTDLISNPDQLGSIGWNAGWVVFDVANDLSKWSAGSTSNKGWNILSVSGNNNIKYIASSESTNVALRPKLTIKYRAGASSKKSLSDEISHVITAATGNNGYVYPEGVSNVIEGVDRSYQIIPKPGYKVKIILVDGVSVGEVYSYIFTSTSASHSISAEFELLPHAHSITATPTDGGSI